MGADNCVVLKPVFLSWLVPEEWVGKVMEKDKKRKKDKERKRVAVAELIAKLSSG